MLTIFVFRMMTPTLSISLADVMKGITAEIGGNASVTRGVYGRRCEALPGTSAA